MTPTPHDVVSKWKRVTARKMQTFLEHFIDLYHLAGVQSLTEYNPSDTHFGFEMGATTTNGGQRWADTTRHCYFR